MPPTKTWGASEEVPEVEIVEYVLVNIVMVRGGMILIRESVG